jgi:ferric-dicitrate binding protein FerR (iron transport regulator)
MPIARLSASRSKAELFQQVGWDEDDERHQETYREMMVSWPALRGYADRRRMRLRKLDIECARIGTILQKKPRQTLP